MNGPVPGTRYIFDVLPEPVARGQVCAWLRECGIDPGEVAVPGAVDVLDGGRLLRWMALDLDGDGRIRARDGAPATVVRELRRDQPVPSFPAHYADRVEPVPHPRCPACGCSGVSSADGAEE